MKRKTGLVGIVIITTIWLCVCVHVSAQPPQQQPLFEHETALTVVSKDLVLEDNERGKHLPVKVSFPKETGTYPVIVFSHGAFGSKDNYQPLIKHWVASGYVCIQPTHSESLSLTGVKGFAAGRGRRIENGRAFQDWPNRPLDVSFVMDNFCTLENMISGLKGKMNTSVVGVGGHSFGAHTAQLLGGTEIGGTKKYADERPVAFLLISPQGREEGFGGPSSVDRNSWASFNRPMMVVTGTKDTGRGGQSYIWRTDPYNFSPEGDKFLLVIEDAYHQFGGIAGSERARRMGRDDPGQVELVQKASLLFWDSYLKRNDRALKTLQSKALTDDRSTQYSFKLK